MAGVVLCGWCGFMWLVWFYVAGVVLCGWCGFMWLVWSYVAGVVNMCSAVVI